MTDAFRGNVVPFAISPGRLRRRAALRAREGRPVEAAELLRHAAEADDSAEGWLLLAEQLSHMRCFEQAERIGYCLVSRPDAGAEAWLTLAQCQLDQEAFLAAEDSLFHALADSLPPAEADWARSELAGIDGEWPSYGLARLPGLMRRAARALQAGDEALALRRFRRAASIAPDGCAVWLEAALLLLIHHRPWQAWLAAARTAASEAYAGHGRLMLCAAAWALDRKRLAMGLLAERRGRTLSVGEENLFLTAVRRLPGTEPLLRAFLADQLRQQPHRVSLLAAQASLALAEGTAAARPWLNSVLRLDPGNTWARAALRYPPEGGAALRWSSAACRAYRASVEVTLAAPPPEALPPLDSWERAAWHWCFEQEDVALQMRLVDHLAASANGRVRALVAQLLTRPDVPGKIKRQVLLRLDTQGCGLPMLAGRQMVVARLRQGTDTSPRTCFLRMALVEGQGWCPAKAFLPWACRAWQAMAPEQRRQAAGLDGGRWARAAVLGFLRAQHQDETERALCRALGPEHPWTERAACRLERRMGLRKGARV